MDPQIEQWQQAFKANTPKVDTEALIQRTRRARQKMKWKAFADVAGAVAVTLFVLYTLIFDVQSTGQLILIACILPVPLAFTVWSFRLRHKQWTMQTADVNSMLNFEKNALHKQVHYWKVSFIACAVMWLGLLLLAIINITLYATWTLWLTQLLANAVVVLGAGWRYRYLKKALPDKLKRIDEVS